MRLAMLLVAFGVTTASAQDSSFSQLRLGGSVFRNPVIGRLADDWRAKTGAQVEISANVGRGELGLAVGHLGYDATTGRPPFTGMLFTLAWLTPLTRTSRVEISAGARLTDIRMDFDDPSIVAGLRTEEELMIGAIARARMPIGSRFSAFVDGSYGVLMLDTKTPMVFVNAGIERSVRTPDWLRGILR